MEPIYNINENAVYESEIRALKDTDPASATRTLNPLFEKMLNNTHAVKKEVEAVDGKIKWAQYTDLSQLGLTQQSVSDSGTLATIIQKMSTREHLICNISNNTPMANLLPQGIAANAIGGLLEIVNHGTNRCKITYTNLASVSKPTGNTVYRCLYRGEDNPNIVTGWVKDVDERDVVWRYYTVLSQMGLTSGDMEKSNTLATICEAMDDYSVYTLPASSSTGFNHLLPSSSGTLEIKRITRNRIHLTFWGMSTYTAGPRYYALYREDGAGDYVKKISPWVKIPDSGDIPNSYRLSSWSRSLMAGEDLNNITEPGIYRCNGSDLATSIINSPTTINFKLIVEYANDTAFILQTVKTRTAVIYTRYRSSNDIWSIWESIDDIKKSVADGKSKVAKAISDKGQATELDAPFATMAENISKIETGIKTDDATAGAGDILSGKTAYVKGNKVTGTIVSKAAATITPKTTSQTIAAGQYLSGVQTITGDVNLIAANIVSGKSIFNITGNAKKVLTGTIQNGGLRFNTINTGFQPQKVVYWYNIGALDAGGREHYAYLIYDADISTTSYKGFSYSWISKEFDNWTIENNGSMKIISEQKNLSGSSTFVNESGVCLAIPTGFMHSTNSVYTNFSYNYIILSN